MKIAGKTWTALEIASRIDHTVLAPDAAAKDVEKACEEARKYRFKSVFTNPFWTPLVADLLDGTGIAAGISAAFPLGSISTKSKVLEVEDALNSAKGRLCAVDMVTNIGMLKEKRYAAYTADIAEVVRTAHDCAGTVVKAILETSLLSPEEIAVACRCASEAGVDFVKTSTGRSGPPLLSHIRIMRQAAAPGVGVKFSGFGTHNSAELACFAFMLGADLLGTPQGPYLVDMLTGDYEELDCIMPA